MLPKNALKSSMENSKEINRKLAIEFQKDEWSGIYVNFYDSWRHLINTKAKTITYRNFDMD